MGIEVNPSLDVIHNQTTSKENNLRISEQHSSYNNEMIKFGILSWTIRYMDEYMYMHRRLNCTW